MGRALVTGRQPTPLLTYGAISVTEEPRAGGRLAYKARARYRDVDGVLRPVSRYGQTKARACDDDDDQERIEKGPTT